MLVDCDGLEKGVTAWGEERAKGLVADRLKPVCCWDWGLAGVGNAVLLFIPVALAIIIDALKGFVVCWPGCNPVCIGGDRDPVPVWNEAIEFCGIGGN